VPRIDVTDERRGLRRAAVSDAVAGLEPGYFALTMSTGIVSIGVRYDGLVTLSTVLMWIAAASYAVLALLTLWRMIAFLPRLRADFGHPRRAFGFCTFVAGTDVLGVRLAQDGHYRAAFTLLAMGVISWIVLGYLVPWTAALGRRERPVLPTATGSWFIWVVASQSVSVLAATLEPTVHRGGPALAILAVYSWSVGVFLYAIVGPLVAARLLIYPIRPADLTPQYWVTMGATAITALAAAHQLQMTNSPMVTATREVVTGASVAFWAFGSWLMPALIALGWWRHVVHRVPLRYEAPLWSIVFPLGMHAVSGIYLGRAIRLPVVTGLGQAETWLAVAAWGLTFAAMLGHLAWTLVLRPQARPAPPDVSVRDLDTISREIAATPVERQAVQSRDHPYAQ
jgi:tellurite resistance protein TehA-like permease